MHVLVFGGGFDPWRDRFVPEALGLLGVKPGSASTTISSIGFT